MSPMTLVTIPDVADDAVTFGFRRFIVVFLPGKRLSLFNYGFCASNMLSDVRKHRG